MNHLPKPQPEALAHSICVSERIAERLILARGWFLTFWDGEVLRFLAPEAVFLLFIFWLQLLGLFLAVVFIKFMVH